jgi:hypothetical protein
MRKNKCCGAREISSGRVLFIMPRPMNCVLLQQHSADVARVCLWPESVLGLPKLGEHLPRLSPRWDKRYLPLDGVRAKFAEHKKPLGTIYLFAERSTDSDALRIEELNPRDVAGIGEEYAHELAAESGAARSRVRQALQNRVAGSRARWPTRMEQNPG